MVLRFTGIICTFNFQYIDKFNWENVGSLPVKILTTECCEKNKT